MSFYDFIILYLCKLIKNTKSALCAVKYALYADFIFTYMLFRDILYIKILKHCKFNQNMHRVHIKKNNTGEYANSRVFALKLNI